MNRRTIQTAKSLPQRLAEIELRSAAGLTLIDWMIVLAQRYPRNGPRQLRLAPPPHPFMDK
jgi:hypothetical protein